MTNTEKRNSSSKKWYILAVLVVIPFMVTLDGTIVNVALPVMTKDLGVSMEVVQSVVISYLVAVVTSILLFGRLGDVKGKGRIFILGVALFTAGSLMAGLARDIYTLNIARIIEGIGGAAAMANNQGIITEVFPSTERGRALGISGVFAAIGTMCGPPIGGLIVTNLSWHYIFLINIPVGVIGIIAAIKLLPKGEKKKESIDIRGTLLLAAALLLFFYALLTGQKSGYLHPNIILSFVASVIVLMLFIKVEKRVLQPVLDLSLFKNQLFTMSIICVLIQFSMSGGVSIVQPFFIEDVLKLNAEHTGLAMVSLSVAMAIVSPISGYLSDKFGAGKLTLYGLIIMFAGVFLLGTMGIGTPIWLLMSYLALIGVGAGMFASPNTSLIMSTAPKDKLGIVGSTNGFMRNFGSVLGVSIYTTVLYSVMSSSAGHQVTGFIPGQPEIFVTAMRTVYFMGAASIAVGILITALRLKKLKQQKTNK